MLAMLLITCLATVVAAPNWYEVFEHDDITVTAREQPGRVLPTMHGEGIIEASLLEI